MVLQVMHLHRRRFGCRLPHVRPHDLKRVLQLGLVRQAAMEDFRLKPHFEEKAGRPAVVLMTSRSRRLWRPRSFLLDDELREERYRL